MSVICIACDKKIKEHCYLLCARCTEAYDLFCLGLERHVYEGLTERSKRTWICPVCTYMDSNDNRPSLKEVKEERAAADDKNKNPEMMAVQEVEGIMADVLFEFQNLRQDIHDLNAQLASVTESLALQTAEYENVLQARDEELYAYKASIIMLQREYNVQEQYNLRNELEIYGLPEHCSEDLLELVLDICAKLGVDTCPNEIDNVWRVRSPPGENLTSRPVAVKFLRKLKRDAVLQSAKRLRGISTEGIIPGPVFKLYINERLTKINRQLYREARSRAHMNNFKFCWVKNGNVFVRKEATHYPVIMIQCFEDLDRYMGPVMLD